MTEPVAVHPGVEQWYALIEPADGVTIWQALADADPQGFVRVEVYPNMTARVIVYEKEHP